MIHRQRILSLLHAIYGPAHSWVLDDVEDIIETLFSARQGSQLHLGFDMPYILAKIREGGNDTRWESIDLSKYPEFERALLMRLEDKAAEKGIDNHSIEHAMLRAFGRTHGLIECLEWVDADHPLKGDIVQLLQDIRCLVRQYDMDRIPGTPHGQRLLHSVMRQIEGSR